MSRDVFSNLAGVSGTATTTEAPITFARRPGFVVLFNDGPAVLQLRTNASLTVATIASGEKLELRFSPNTTDLLASTPASTATYRFVYVY